MLRQENQVIITTTHFPEKKTDPPHVLAVVCITHIFIRLSSRCVCVCVIGGMTAAAATQ